MNNNKIILNIKLYFVFVFAAVILSAGNIQSQNIISPSNSKIVYAGRLDFTKPKEPVFEWSGVSIRVKFTGSSIKLKMKSEVDNNYFWIFVDSNPPYKINTITSKESYVLAEGLTGDSHIVEIFKLTEALHKSNTFLGFELDAGGKLLEYAPDEELKFQFIGNSITCGYGNETNNISDGFKPYQENHYQTYAALTSRNFHAEHWAVSRSGIGIFNNRNDFTEEPDNDCMYYVYDRIYLNKENPQWDHSKYSPDLICINLGTNDVATKIPNHDLYEETYTKFVENLRSHHSQAKIVALLGPMLTKNNLDTVRSRLKSIVSKFNKAGDNGVYFFEMSPETGDLGFGGHYHPTVKQHHKNGEELSDFIASITSWGRSAYLVAGELIDSVTIHISCNRELESIGDALQKTTIAQDDKLIPVRNISIDENDNTKIIIKLADEARALKNTVFNYRHGNITDKQQVKLRNITNFEIDNNLKVSQSPYNGSLKIPGTIQFEDYDLGGEGIAYHDADEKKRLDVTIRPDDFVDIETCNDEGKTNNLGWTADGEWLEYSLSEMSAGEYIIEVRVSSDEKNPGELAIKLGDGPEGSGFEQIASIDIKGTGGWESWQTFSSEAIHLNAGADKVLRVEIIGDAFDLNWMKFIEVVHLTNISIAPESVTLNVGDTTQLSVSFNPENATDKNLNWTSEDEAVAIVEPNGQIIAISTGKTTIAVKSNEGGFVTKSIIEVQDITSTISVNSNYFRMFPNPVNSSSSQLHIESDILSGSILSIVSATGKLVYCGASKGNSILLPNIKSLCAGIYVINIIAPKGMVKKKLLVH